ncbi:MAG: LacI family DNA-binding transcriptional regulator [Pseudomonadota bacterium]
MAKNELKSATSNDVADMAGVSLATVDRVLNGRRGVRHETRERVKDAIERLGFRPDASAANLAKRRTYRFLFVLPSRHSGFAEHLEQAVKAAPAALDTERVVISIKKAEMIDHGALLATLREIDPSEWDGIAVKATDAPGIREALDDLVDYGVPVVTLVSDVPSSKRQRYIGIDNTAAGRVAGNLMGRFLHRLEGSVGLIAGSLMIRDHVERWVGFEQVIKADYPHLRVLPVAESSDNCDVAGQIVERLLDEHRDLIGIYSISAGNKGILASLERLKPQPRPMLIVHELSPPIRRALLDGAIDAVINQDVEIEAHRALRSLIALCKNEPALGGHDRVGIGIFLRDNLP